MIDKLNARADAVGDRRAAALEQEVARTLRETLPDDVQVENGDSGVSVRSRRLSRLLLDHSDLRDIAFLMRSAR